MKRKINMSELQRHAELASNIKNALDGRTYRWLSQKTQIPESDLSRKMNGKMFFKAEDLEKINSVLKTDFALP